MVQKKIDENVAVFEKLLLSIQRPGIDDLLEFIRQSDFYEAPASTKFHLAEPGGLLQHSLNTYYALRAKRRSPIWKEYLDHVPEETLKLVALCHDLCKVFFYKESYRNQKNYDPEVVNAAEPHNRKRDAQGEYIWETVRTYEVEERLPLGHGEKSALIVSQYIPVTPDELLAIRWHMGFSEDKSQYSTIGKAMEKCPLLLALYEGDLTATKLLETDNSKYLELFLKDIEYEQLSTLYPPSESDPDDDQCPF